MAGRNYMGASLGVKNVAKSIPAVRGFSSGDNPLYELPLAIRGTTKDSAGAALGAVTLTLLRTADNSLVHQALSDSEGTYIIAASDQLTHYVVAYKAGSPDVTGATVNTLVGT